mmetsp:Transcript_38474/g.80956  ORF Transcript_38474/g.80956 Transcript_38474/m.80956 type:complete len:129 (+) Transcript_38474:413-799(+)
MYRQRCQSHLSKLQGSLQFASDQKEALTDEQVDNECQLMEQLFVSRKMKEEFITIRNVSVLVQTHEGHEICKEAIPNFLNLISFLIITFNIRWRNGRPSVDLTSKALSLPIRSSISYCVGMGQLVEGI